MKQTFDNDCGPKALQSVLAYYGKDTEETELMKRLHTTKNGTTPHNMIGGVKDYGFNVDYGEFSFERLASYVSKGIPVIVLLQAWAEKPMSEKDWANEWDSGHYVVVIGIIDNVVVFEDPMSTRRTWLTKDEFLSRWHDKVQDGNIYKNFSLAIVDKAPSKKIEHME